jgi:hypothetical protein
MPRFIAVSARAHHFSLILREVCRINKFGTGCSELLMYGMHLGMCAIGTIGASFWKPVKHYCLVYGRLGRWFALVIGFIDHLQVVIEIDDNIVSHCYSTKQSILISSVYLHLSSPIHNTGIMQVSLNHTLPI